MLYAVKRWQTKLHEWLPMLMVLGLGAGGAIGWRYAGGYFVY